MDQELNIYGNRSGVNVICAEFRRTCIITNVISYALVIGIVYWNSLFTLTGINASIS